MVINCEEFKKKLAYLGMGTSISTTGKLNEQSILFDTIDGIVYGFTDNHINNIKIEIGPTDKEFYTIVDYTLLYNFIKSCKGNITLETTNNFLQIKSDNVKCKLPTHTHIVTKQSCGINSPDNNYIYDFELTEQIEINKLKPIINETIPIEIYRNIYFGDNIMVSDTDNVMIVKKRIFTKDIILSYSSVQLLNMLTNVKYTYITNGTRSQLAIKSDELYATITIIDNKDNSYQYTDLLNLFDEFNNTKRVTVNTSILAEAINTASIFKTIPCLVFNKKGIFVTIPAVDFMYIIDNSISCDDRTILLPLDLSKKIINLGQNVELYYNKDCLLRCDIDNINEILSIEEMKVNV